MANRPQGMQKKLTAGELLVGRMLRMERVAGIYKYTPGQSAVVEIECPPQMQEFNYDKQAKLSFVDEDRMAILCTMGRYREDHQWYVLGLQKAGTNYIGQIMTIPKEGPEAEWQIDDGAHEKLLKLNDCKNGCSASELKGDCLEMATTLFEELGVGIQNVEDMAPETAYMAREMNVRHLKLDWGQAYMATAGEI